MQYSIEPRIREKLTPKELFEETNNDPIKSKSLRMIRSKKYERDVSGFYIGEGVEDFKEKNPNIFDGMLTEGRKYLKSNNGNLRDIVVSIKVDKKNKNYTLQVFNLTGEELTKSVLYQINPEFDSNAHDFEFQIRYVAIDDKGGLAFIIDSKTNFEKVKQIVRNFVWKS